MPQSVERSAHPVADHLKEVFWAVFMIDLVLVLLALLFAPHFGRTITLWVFGIMAAAATGLIGGLALLNVIAVWIYERWEWKKKGPPPEQ